MKLFVQARKDGYNVLYPKQAKTDQSNPFYQFAGDLRPETKDSNNKLFGKYIYTISFANGGCIFTKHIIVQDVQRAALGNIGFSFFIPNNKKLSGNDSIKLLDDLLNTYCKEYCPDYYLENKTEDWSIFETMANQYDSLMNNLSADDVENYDKGIGEAAYIYYSDELELKKYFDSPYHEEFRPYKQVFFVEKNLEDKSDNPLNAIPHDPNANLTGKIDLENPKYKLIYNQQAKGGVKIEVKVNGSLRYSKSKIKRKEDLQIIWSKEFYKPIEKKGTWEEIGSEFLIIDNDKKRIEVRDKEPKEPITYTLRIQTKDRFSNPITDSEITLKINNYLPERKAVDGFVEITAEELQNNSYIVAKKNNLISPKREIKLEDTEGIIHLTLCEQKEVVFTIKDDKKRLVYNFNLKIDNKEIQNKEGKVVFKGEEVDKTCQISVSHRDYETESFNYCPAKDENPKDVILKKKTFSGQGQSPNRKKYYIKIDEKKGKRSCKGSYINEYEYEHPQFNCDAKYGYKFVRWESYKNSPDGDCDGYYVAIFKGLWYRKVPKFAWVFIIIFMVSLSIFLLTKSCGKDKVIINDNLEISSKINAYVLGVELNLDTLKEFQRNYCESDTFVQYEEQERSLMQRIWPFFSNDNNNSTIQSSVIPDFCLQIENAMALRRSINNGKIDEIIGYSFSVQQQEFKNAIDSIDDKYKKQIGDTLLADTVSKMNLNQIASLIRKTQQELRGKESAVQKDSKNNANQDKPISEKSNNPIEKKTQPQKQQQSSNSLETEFWSLVNSGNAQKQSYDVLLTRYKNVGGEIIVYLNKICKNSETFRKFVNIPAMDRESAKTLQEIEIK